MTIHNSGKNTHKHTLTAETQRQNKIWKKKELKMQAEVVEEEVGKQTSSKVIVESQEQDDRVFELTPLKSNMITEYAWALFASSFSFFFRLHLL